MLKGTILLVLALVSTAYAVTPGRRCADEYNHPIPCEIL